MPRLVEMPGAYSSPSRGGNSNELLRAALASERESLTERKDIEGV